MISTPWNRCKLANGVDFWLNWRRCDSGLKRSATRIAASRAMLDQR